MSVLVLGGAGYIGSHATYQLIENGEDVIVIDNLQTGHIKAIHPNASFYQGNIQDTHFLNNVFSKEKIDAVFHFAASSLVGQSMERPISYFNNNVNSMIQLLQTMEKYHVKKIIFSSTAAVYGDVTSLPIIETNSTLPTNPYGESKLMMEKIMEWVNKAHGIEYVSLRYFNVAGAKQTGEIGEDHQPETHLIPIVLQAAMKQREQITIFGDDYETPDGTCIRDYIHVEDLVQAHLLALNYLNTGGKSDVFNLGSATGYSVKEIIDKASEITNIHIPFSIGERRLGDPPILIANANKAKTILQWQPKYENIGTIIHDAWNWHNKHPYGYQTQE